MDDISRRRLLQSTSALGLASALPAFADDAQKKAEPKKNETAPPKEPYADGVLVAGEPPKIEKGSFTVAVLPDTQNYSEKFPDTYVAQTRWLVENQQARNISCVLHLGDVTNHNTPVEWENAKEAMKVLDGKLPYFMVPGNHDYSLRGGCSDRTTFMNDYFSVSSFRDRPTASLSSGRLDAARLGRLMPSAEISEVDQLCSRRPRA